MKGRDETEFVEGVRRDASGGKSVFVDYDLYAEYLEGADLTEEQKHEFLQALWTIICTFVDLGFGVHPVQLAQKACGKAEQSRDAPSVESPDDVNCSGQPLIAEFEDVALRESGERERGAADAANS